MASIENIETILLTVQIIYFTFKLLVEILSAVGLLDRMVALFDFFFTCFRQPTNNRDHDNDNGEQDEADVVLEDLDGEAAPVQDQTRASNSSFIV